MTRTDTRQNATRERVTAAAQAAVRSGTVAAVLLHGSRARGEEHEPGDRDVAVLGGEKAATPRSARQALDHLAGVDVIALTPDRW